MSSVHARHRSAQRAITPAQIELVLDWGQLIRQPHGREAFHLGRREVRLAALQGVTIPEGAINLGVVMAADGTIVTAVRSPDRHRLKVFGRRKPRRRR